jgi:hypothetical protein
MMFDPPRVRSGDHSQVCVIIGHWGADYFDHGLRADVAVVPGRPYTFSAWTRLETGTPGNDKIQRRVGTDPTGGTDPGSPNVVWSAPDSGEDAWAQMSVSATAQASTVTVFVRAEVIQQVNDVYYWLDIDDCDFVVDITSPPGFLQPGWNLVSVPVDPVPTDVATVLQGCADAGNMLDSRLFRYVPGQYEVYPAGFADVDSAVGYWLYLDYGCACSPTGRETFRRRVVPLADGWNLIGCPQSGSVALSSCEVTDGAYTLPLTDAVVAGWVDGALYYWEPGLGYRLATPAGYGSDDSLQPWRGYWMRANGPGLSLVVPGA